MDGIEITRVVATSPVFFDCQDSGDYPFAINNDDVSDTEIMKMIQVNEGFLPDQPEFKHSVKLTPHLTHPSLKKRVNSRRNLTELDDDEPLYDDASPLGDKPVPTTHDSLGGKIKKYRDILRNLHTEVTDLRRVKKDLERDVKKVNRELQKKLLLLQKYDDRIKKPGRRLGGAKLRQELGIFTPEKIKTVTQTSDDNLMERRKRGRPRKYPITPKNSSTSDFENIPENAEKIVKRRLSSLSSDTDPLVEPLKEKDLNSKPSLKVMLTKIDHPDLIQNSDAEQPAIAPEDPKPVQIKADPDAPMSPRRRSRREVRYTEKFADLMQKSPKLGDIDSFVVRKICDDEESEGPPPEIQPISSVKPKNKRRRSQDSGNKIQRKKAKTGSDRNARGGTPGSTSDTSSCLSCRNVKEAKTAMFQGVAEKKICEVCVNHGAIQCQKCFTFVHPDCVGDTSKEEKINWICPACISGTNPCFVCKSEKGTRQMCLTKGCGKFYHLDCLKLFPQTKFNHDEPRNEGLLRDPNDTGPPPLEIIACARHTCHTCSSDNPLDAVFTPCEKLLTCVKCPTSYHCTPGVCLAAGSDILSLSKILCGKHIEQSNKAQHVNITWCFVCTNGRSLTYCALCPSAIHPECLKIEPPKGVYYCEECESGRFPLHGEIVWVKLASCRWWPAKVLYPDEAPECLLNWKREPCQFPIMFFGSKDYQWASRGRTYLYNEADGQMKVFSKDSKKRYERKFQLALQEASEAFQQRKEVIEIFKVKEKPERFIKILSCKYMTKKEKKNGEEDPQACACSPEDPEPCGPLSNCLNRGLFIECRPDFCPAGTNCHNRRFTKREYAPLEYFKTTDRGWGVRCKIDIVQGQFIIEYVGQVIDDAQLEQRLKKKAVMKNSKYYLMRLDSNQVIDAEPMGNMARFINHSCQPNCETQKWTVNRLRRIGIFAKEDIPQGTELTFNYDWNLPGMKTACHCNADACSGFIGDSIKTDKSSRKPSNKKAKIVSKKQKNNEALCCHCEKPATSDIIMCSDLKCRRVVHKDCGDPKKPERWFCALHFCKVCDRKTSRHCQTCKEAYCSYHVQNRIFSGNNGTLFCVKHLPQENRARRTSAYILNKDKTESSSDCSTSMT